MPNRHFLRSDIFTFVMVYSFYFLLAGCRRNEFNSLWGDKRSARMRSDSVKNMSAYADQNHAPSLAAARLELNPQKRFQDVLPEAQSDHPGRHTLTFQLFFPEEV